jgi:hypothetical protein
MKKSLAAWSLCLVVSAAWAAESPPDFSRYQVILDRKPFGTIPPPTIETPAITPENSFAKSIRLSALLETDDGGIRVGLIDQTSNKNFFLGVGESEEGIELVSASYKDEEAVLKKGAEMAVIKLQSGDIQPLSPAQQQARMNMGGSMGGMGMPQPPMDGSRRPSYAERRLARLQQRQPPQPPPEPKYTGVELEKHLQDYQMEVIRQGLPPLPIPLTPEMDQQLVNEGVLPPAEEPPP